MDMVYGVDFTWQDLPEDGMAPSHASYSGIAFNWSRHVRENALSYAYMREMNRIDGRDREMRALTMVEMRRWVDRGALDEFRARIAWDTDCGRWIDRTTGNPV